MEKEKVLEIIDEVVNNREIDSIRNAILAIKDKVIEAKDESDDWTKDYVARLKLRGDAPLTCANCTQPYFDGAKYICIDTLAKIDTGIYGAYWYE